MSNFHKQSCPNSFLGGELSRCYPMDIHYQRGPYPFRRVCIVCVCDLKYFEFSSCIHMYIGIYTYKFMYLIFRHLWFYGDVAFLKVLLLRKIILCKTCFFSLTTMLHNMDVNRKNRVWITKFHKGFEECNAFVRCMCIWMNWIVYI